MNYEFSSTAKENFSLHDCRATVADLKGNVLTFYFPEGIFYNEYEDCWPNTGPAAVKYVVEYLDEVTFYLFEERLCQKTVKEYTIQQLIEKINSQQWQLEFLYRYDGYREVMYTVDVWFNKKPWSYQGQLFIRNTSETFFWNIRQECKELSEE